MTPHKRLAVLDNGDSEMKRSEGVASFTRLEALCDLMMKLTIFLSGVWLGVNLR